MTKADKSVAEVLGLNQHSKLGHAWVKYAVVVVLAGIGVWYWLSAIEGRTSVRYVTAEASIGDFSVTVTATGTVEPTNLVEISSELSGTVKTVHVDYNDTVGVGTVLAELDTSKLEAQLAVRKASLDAAVARVAMAQATLDEAKEKYEAGLNLEERGVTAYQTFVSQRAAYIRAQSELQSALADQSLAEANLELQQAEMDKACICSPIQGVVLDRSVDAGQIVASSLSAPVLFTLAEDLTKMQLQVYVDEADIGQVAVGNMATFTVDAYDEKLFPAEITEIRFAPETIDGVVTYKAILTIDNSDLLLRPGMTATADITVAEIKDALTVPNAALRYAPQLESTERDEERSGLLGILIPTRPDRSDQADYKTLWLLKDDTPEEIAVRAGASDGSVTQILDGTVKNGDLVITGQIDE